MVIDTGQTGGLYEPDVMASLEHLGLAIAVITPLIGAMVIGIAVDDTIHFMHRFHRDF